jgi:DNA polymerase-3 subunit delta'
MTFDSFLGNPRIIGRIQTKLRENRFPHGLIFSGPKGVGKHTLALMVAKTLNCERGVGERGLMPPVAGKALFCGDCPACRKIDAGTHPDVVTIGVEEDASQIRIAQIRQILSILDFQPLEGRNKVFIIDPADLMNAEASNALLKGLEEPPDKSFFILITVNVHELLMTVRSRCQIYNFSPLTLDEVRRHGIEDELLVRWSQGSAGRARCLDMRALREQRALLLDFLETAITAGPGEFRQMLAASADLARSKQDFQSHVSFLSVLIADLLYIAEGVPEMVVNIDIRDQLNVLSERATVERLIHLAEFLKFIETSMKNYLNRQILTDMLALTGNEMTSKILHDNLGKSR